MKNAFDDSWQEWVNTNIERGCDRVGMAEILLENEFSPELIAKALNVTISRRDASELPDTWKKQETDVDQSQSSNAANQSSLTAAALLKQSTEWNEDEVQPHINIPRAKQVKIEGDKLEIFTLENFLNAQECIDLISLIRNNLRESTTTNDSGDYANHRTSKTCDLGNIDCDLAREIDRRICAAIGIDSSYSETIQAQWYEVGEEFKAHTDYFEPNTKEFELHAGDRGQRTWTFMINLNTCMQGGSTKFTNVGQEFFPQAGNAIIWNSMRPDGTPNVDSMHWGMPVERGFKVIITKWFRDKGKGKMLPKELNEYVPAYTRHGFLKSKIPEDLFAKLRSFYDANLDKAQDERVEGFIFGQDEETRAPSELVVLSDELKTETHERLKLLVEAWIGHYLEPTYVFGIRRYLDSAVLKPHRDRGKTHVASCILNISQDVNEDWPLLIEDHTYRRHNIILKPGDMVFYEGARLLHGRPEAFNGDHFANMFVHYKLVN